MSDTIEVFLILEQSYIGEIGGSPTSLNIWVQIESKQYTMANTGFIFTYKPVK